MHDTVVIIRARRHFLTSVAFAAWLFVWLFGGLGVLPEIWADPRLTPVGPVFLFVAVWSVLWALGGCVVVWAILWMTGGCERLTIHEDQLIVNVGLWSRLFVSRRVFAMSSVRNMRIDPVERRLRGGTIVSHRLTFDYEGKVIHLWCDIPELDRASLRASPLVELFNQPSR